MKSQKQPSTDDTFVAASASPVPPEEEFVVGDAASPPPAHPSQTPSTVRIASPVTVGSPGAKEVTLSSQRCDEATSRAADEIGVPPRLPEHSQTPSIRIASPVTVGSPGAKEVTLSSQRIDEATPHSIASVEFEDPEWEEVTLTVLKQEGILHVEEHPYGPPFPPQIDEPSDQEENSKRKSKKATVIESAECESTNLSKAKALLGGFVSTIGHSLSIFFTITPDSEGYERRAERRRTVQHVAW